MQDNSKLNTMHPLSFIFQNRDHGFKGRRRDHRLNHAAEVVIIDNNGAAIRPLGDNRREFRDIHLQSNRIDNNYS